MKHNNESDSLCSKRKDQLLGFWSFILLNIVVLGCTISTNGEVSSILPWIFNGPVILVSLAVRPHFAVGYLASFAGLIAVSLLYIASCFVTCFAASGSGLTNLAIICPALLFPAWLILAGSQSRKLYRNACGNKSQSFEPRYQLEESSPAKLSQDEIRQRAEQEWEERESREND